MHRRDFLKATGLAGAASLAPSAAAAAASAARADKQVLELRLYTVEGTDMRGRLDKFLATVAVPAWNRLGIKPVGAFSPLEDRSDDLYVLLPHESAAAFVCAADRLWADDQYVKAGAEFLDAPKDAPIYKRIETQVMLAFDAVPKVEVPTQKATRVLQLRIYESHADERARRKIAMFNTGGEIAIFRRAGMNPVFFGQSLAGTRMPNLTYMLAFDDAAAKDAAWKKFLEDPEWKKLSGDPTYKDTVSKITNIMLKPAEYSQI